MMSNFSSEAKYGKRLYKDIFKMVDIKKSVSSEFYTY